MWRKEGEKMSKIEIKNSINYAGIQEPEQDSHFIEVKPWPDPCAALFEAWVVNKDAELAYQIVLKHFPAMAHIYKPDNSLD
jgi:hypothetical protein